MHRLMKLAIGAVVIAALGAWERQHPRSQDGAEVAQAASAGPANFVDLPPREGGPDEPVLVIAAQNCPEAAAQRADQLAAALSKEGIRVARVHSISFRMEGPNASVDRVNALLGGTLPAVVVRSRGMSNPNLAQVMAEYRGTH